MQATKITYGELPWKDIVPGRIRYKPVKLGDFGASIVLFYKGVDEPSHSHVEDQLVYCLSGLIEFRIDHEDGRRQLETIRPGDMLAIPSGMVHGARVIEETQLYVCWNPMRRFDAHAVIA